MSAWQAVRAKQKPQKNKTPELNEIQSMLSTATEHVKGKQKGDEIDSTREKCRKTYAHNNNTPTTTTTRWRCVKTRCVSLISCSVFVLIKHCRWCALLLCLSFSRPLCLSLHQCLDTHIYCTELSVEGKIKVKSATAEQQERVCSVDVDTHFAHKQNNSKINTKRRTLLDFTRALSLAHTYTNRIISRAPKANSFTIYWLPLIG